ncbi:hypothetical protein I302_105850 [Kwoniella bestiolae CBS 10118]|uniref:Uncharacterized protein n=1 Tax=Kwoniella bestiolae CBS 10118 TaxID=1296100 RepID=A0A1B9G2B8_9TREE|nr:hypothetical protein I302_04974 [Kwoniella bestiolae CBS 10118]OCF25164.1 hypothetical protein I302_04974 [Kwoniella bestiolae CBS 10118]
MRSIISLTFLLIATLFSSVLASYVDMVIDSEKDLARTLDQFVEDHPDTYDFIAKSFDGRIVIQVRFEDDTVGIEGFFTETPELLDDLDVAQQSILSATTPQGLDEQSGTTLDSLQAYRYRAPEEEGIEKRLICQPCRYCLREVNEHLKKRVSLCVNLPSDPSLDDKLTARHRANVGTLKASAAFRCRSHTMIPDLRFKGFVQAV